MEYIYKKLIVFSSNLRAFMYEVSYYNPGISAAHKMPKKDLIIEADKLITQLKIIRKDLVDEESKYCDIVNNDLVEEKEVN